MGLVDLGKRQLFLILGILKLKIKLLSQVCNQDLDLAFSKCFTETDTLTSMERSPTRGFSLLASGGQVKLAVRVKPFRNEVHGALPFVRAVAQCLEHDKQFVILFEVVLSKLAILLQVVEMAIGSRRSIA